MFALARTPPPARDWYFTASPEARKEYDAFGPWIGVVTKREDLPPRFRAAWPEIRDARFVLKLPIRADRRDVRPGMDLYDMVLAIGEDGATVLKLTRDDTARRELGWDSVAGISIFTDLLYGCWTLLLRDGDTISATYNTVSAHHFATLGDFIRQKLSPDVPRPEQGPDTSPVPIKDLFYRNQARTVRTTSGGRARVLHSEPLGRWCRDDRNRRRLSTGLLVLDAGDALVAIDRGVPTRGFFQPSYAARQVFVPYRRLTGFAFTPGQPDRRGFAHLTLYADGQAVPLACLEFPEEIMAHLSRHGVRSEQPPAPQSQA